MAEAIPVLSWAELLARLSVAAALGAAVGLERELRERQAGLRTHLLVSVGAALFTIVSAHAWSGFPFSTAAGLSFDPSRIAAGIVTGIGFLGAGAIIRQGLFVRGLTTAASLWAVAAIGLASGAGYYEAAAIATAIVVVSLWPLRVVARPLFDRFRPEASESGASPDSASWSTSSERAGTPERTLGKPAGPIRRPTDAERGCPSRS